MGRQGQQQDWIGVRWGVPCSALFHSAVVALVLLTLPEPRKPKALPKEIPVEVVREAPKKKPVKKPKEQARKTPPEPEKKKPVAKKEPPKPPKPPKPPEPKLTLNEKQPELPEKKAARKEAPPKEKPAAPPKQKPAEKKPAEKKPVEKKPAEKKPAEKKLQVAEKKSAKPAGNPDLKTEARKPAAGKPDVKPEARKPAAGNPAKKPLQAEKKPQLAPKPPLAAKEPQLALGPNPPVLRPKPAPPPKPKTGSLKVPPQIGAVPHPDAKKRKLLGQWVLHPLTLDTGHRCGMQRVTGTMTLVNRRVRGGGTEVQYLAEIRTTIYWERCRPEGALSKFVLIRRGDRVFLVGAKGVMDHGLMRGNVMILRDSLGDSYWHLRK
jgi:hypothetical protein